MRQENESAIEMGKRIRERREELGLSETELAGLSQITAATLSHIELGNRYPKTDTLLRIAEVLKVPLSYLQPSSLDSYSTIPPAFYPVLLKLGKKTPLEQRKLLKMLEAMIDIL